MNNTLNNILFFLTPKSNCCYLMADDTLRQAIGRMEAAHYAALPILNKRGEYCGTLTEGDVLWALKNQCELSLKKAERLHIMEITHRKDNDPVTVSATMKDLIDRAARQNFVPVIDDKHTFIGIVTRRSILQYCRQALFETATPQ